MSLAQVGVVAAAGFLAGTINAIVGSGSLITFPTLLFVGLPPLTANVTNTVGVVFGNASAVYGYRRELKPQLRRTLWLGALSAAGAAIGAMLLLLLPPRIFGFVVPALVALAVILVVLQPYLSRRIAPKGVSPAWAIAAVAIGVFLVGIYGGYFGAAQGVILMALLTLFLRDPIQELNAAKNVLAGVANLVAALIFVVAAPVSWEHAAVIAVSSVAGGQAGAVVGRRLSAPVLRLIIVTAGVAALVKLVAGG